MKNKFKLLKRNTFLFLRERVGFTLTELLVVMAIIALLIAMLMPALKGAKEAGKTVVCINYQRQIVQAFLVYAAENNHRLPHYGTQQPITASQFWWRLVKHILAPAANTASGYLGELGAEYGFRCPAASTDDQYSYGVNVGQPPIWIFASYCSTNLTKYPGSKYLHELSPKTMLVADSRFTLFFQPECYYKYNLDTDYDGDGINDTADDILSGGYASPYNCIQPRHPGKSLVAGFADGSCRKVTLVDWAQNKDAMWGP